MSIAFAAEPSRRHVVWVTSNFFPEIGGVQELTEQLVRGLATEGVVSVVAANGASLRSPLADAAIRLYRCANLGRPPTPEAWDVARQQLAELLRGLAPDVVHFASAGLAVYRDAVPRGVPSVVTVHGNDLTRPWQLTPGADLVPAIVEGVSSCDRVLAVSRHTEELARQCGVRAPIVLLPPACDIVRFQARPVDATFRRANGIQEDALLVLTVGRMVPRKGHVRLAEALASCERPVHWMVVGRGPVEAELRAAVARCGLTKRVSFLGGVTNDTLALLYNACDVFALVPEEIHAGGTIDSEGFGIVFHEAGACAKAVLASDVSGCREAVLHEVTGLLAPPSELVPALQRLADSPQLRARLGMGGATHVRGAGGWLGRVAELNDIYAEL